MSTIGKNTWSGAACGRRRPFSHGGAGPAAADVRCDRASQEDHAGAGRLFRRHGGQAAAGRERCAPHCSSMLFDPNFAVPAAIDLMPARCGLIMTLEEHRVEETAGGRKSRVIDQLERRQDPRHGRRCRQGAGVVSARRRCRRQRASAALRARDRRRVRAATTFPMCSNCWFIPSSAAPITPPTTSSRPANCPALVIDSVREFAKPEYGVDLLKLESPLAANEPAGRDGGPAAKRRAAGIRRHRRDLQPARHSLGVAFRRRRA